VNTGVKVDENRTENVLGKENNGLIAAPEKEESEEGKNRDKKMMMVKLVIQKIYKITKYSNEKCSVWLVKKSCRLVPLVSDPGISILGFVGKGVAPVVRQLGVEMAGGIFVVVLFFSLLSLVLWAICYKQKL
jgi:hypothetical protein